jgi:hypothetical protein
VGFYGTALAPERPKKPFQGTPGETLILFRSGL